MQGLKLGSREGGESMLMAPQFQAPSEDYSYFYVVSYNEFGELQEYIFIEKEHLGQYRHLNELILCQQEGLDQCNVFLNTVK